jgi:hypothetical protein
MAEYPVLDPSGRCLGFLETHGAEPYYMQQLHVLCRAPVSVAASGFLNVPPEVMEMPPTVVFNWSTQHTRRHGGSIFDCACLVTTAPAEHIDMLPGFVWFVEKFGHEVRP